MFHSPLHLKYLSLGVENIHACMMEDRGHEI